MRALFGRYAGVILITLSSVLFSAMNYLVKLATATIPGSEVAFFRFVVGFLLVALLTGVTGLLRRFGWKGPGVAPSWRRFPLIVARGTLGGIAILTLYLALGSGNLTNVTALSNSYAVFATLFGIVLLRERPGTVAYSALAVSICGVLLMVGGFRAMKPGDVMALASSVVSGLAIVVVRELRRTESTWSIFASLCFFGAIVTGLYGWRDFTVPHGTTLLFTLGASLTGFAAQVSMTAGYKHCTAALGSILSISSVPLTGVLGYLILGDRLTPPELLGALLVVSGCVAVALAEGGRSNPANSVEGDRMDWKPSDSRI